MYYFISYTLFYAPGTHNSAKNHHRSLISQLSPRTVFSDFALWRHQSCSVTSRERGILALWRHIRRLFLHAQIGANAIFTSVTTVNIDFSSPGIHGLACKKMTFKKGLFILNHSEMHLSSQINFILGFWFLLLPRKFVSWAKHHVFTYISLI